MVNLTDALRQSVGDKRRSERIIDTAPVLRPLLDGIEGFISIERFESLSKPGKLLSLGFFRDEQALQTWRNLPPHRGAQAKGRGEFFANYQLRIAGVIRDYSMSDRAQAPTDSRAVHG